MLAASRRTRVLVLSADPDTEGIQRALQAGAAGYLHKTRGVSALTRAIERVQRGEVVIDVPKPSVPRDRTRPSDARRLAAFLTPRERECLVLLVEGLDTGGIATKLGVSPATVRTHVQSVLMKLGVHSRLEAASYAVRYGLLDEAARFPSGRTGLAARLRRRMTRAAASAPPAARAASTTPSATCLATSGRGRAEAVGVGDQPAPVEQGQPEAQPAGPRRDGRGHPGGMRPAAGGREVGA